MEEPAETGLPPLSLRRQSSLEETVLASFNECKSNKHLQHLPLGGRRTKIICTIGPATQSVEGLCALLNAGMSVVRMNFSHGTHDYHAKTLENTRKAVSQTGIPCSIMLDTKGPEIRSGKLKGHEPIILSEGSRIKILCGHPPGFLGDETTISVDYKNLPKVVVKDSVVKIDDGLITIRVDNVGEDFVEGIVLNTAELGETKGVNLPGCTIDLPALTEKDKEDLTFGVEQGVDYIAPSFIRKADDIHSIRAHLGPKGKHIKIIPKIESEEGLLNFDEVLDVSDGVMVARGDLGVEIPIQKVCLAQKSMIRKCNAVGKFVITATQMLESMVKNPRPTRAEATDIANAVYDGTDCVMLSGESAKGLYPTEAVKTMARICSSAEASLDHRLIFSMISSLSCKAHSFHNARTEAMTSAAVKAAIDLDAALILALSNTGRTAYYLSKYRPPVPIITVTPNATTFRQVLCYSGLWPVMVKQESDDERRYEQAINIAKENKWCKTGDCVVVVSGKHDQSGSAHMLRVFDVQ